MLIYLFIYFFLGKALSITTYIRNRVKTNFSLLTSYEYWIGLRKNVENLNVYDCTAHVLILKPLRDKLDKKNTGMQIYVIYKE
jgi:hypothetical protein